VTALTAAQRAELAARIRQDRIRVLARAEALARDFDDIVTSSADAVRDDEHDPEGATIAFERTQVATLLADARDQLSQLDAAEARLALPTAGRCASCDGPIGMARLRARPMANRCVACADVRKAR
jgi:DnaK suppressor protein